MTNIKTIYVENMKSPRGSIVANQFLIHTEDGDYFQSYETIIAFKPYGNGAVLLDFRWDCSPTTSKYRNMFLCQTTAETRQLIKDGHYQVIDMNNRETAAAAGSYMKKMHPDYNPLTDKIEGV